MDFFVSHDSFSISEFRKCHAISRFLTGGSGKQCFAWTDLGNIVVAFITVLATAILATAILVGCCRVVCTDRDLN